MKKKALRAALKVAEEERQEAIEWADQATQMMAALIGRVLAPRK